MFSAEIALRCHLKRRNRADDAEQDFKGDSKAWRVEEYHASRYQRPDKVRRQDWVSPRADRDAEDLHRRQSMARESPEAPERPISIATKARISPITVAHPRAVLASRNAEGTDCSQPDTLEDPKGSRQKALMQDITDESDY